MQIARRPADQACPLQIAPTARTMDRNAMAHRPGLEAARWMGDGWRRRMASLG